MSGLRLVNITKKFDEFVAVDGFELDVRDGEFITLLGPSGCGKTTTLRVIAGFLNPDSGEVLINERLMNDIPPNKRNTGMCFQSYALFPHMTVEDNIRFGLRRINNPQHCHTGDWPVESFNPHPRGVCLLCLPGSRRHGILPSWRKWSRYGHLIPNSLATRCRKVSMLKVDPSPDYPPEEGRYLRGNDRSPVVVVVVLNHPEDKIPREIEALVRAGLEAGASLSGTVQTENIGFEKIICNVIANPNIRWAVLTGPESEGHLTGEAFKALLNNGVDEKKRIVGTNAPHPLLFNLPLRFIERFRAQVALIDLQFKGTPETVRRAVWSCYQEEPVQFEGQEVYDIGAYPAPPLSGRITGWVMEPWKQPQSEQERQAVRKMWDWIDRVRKKQMREDDS